jgi:hypothetical protein
MLLWFELVLCDAVVSNRTNTLLPHASSVRDQIEPTNCPRPYIDTKKRDAVPVIAAIGDVSHFLNDAAIGEYVPLWKKTKCHSSLCAYALHQ